MLRHIRHIYNTFGRLRRHRIIPVITCDEQMQSRCALLLAQVLHSRGVQVCLATPDNVGAVCLRLLTSSVLQRKASKCSVKEATGPRGNREKGDKRGREFWTSLITFTGTWAFPPGRAEGNGLCCWTSEQANFAQSLLPVAGLRGILWKQTYGSLWLKVVKFANKRVSAGA